MFAIIPDKEIEKINRELAKISIKQHYQAQQRAPNWVALIIFAALAFSLFTVGKELAESSSFTGFASLKAENITYSIPTPVQPEIPDIPVIMPEEPESDSENATNQTTAGNETGEINDEIEDELEEELEEEIQLPDANLTLNQTINQTLNLTLNQTPELELNQTLNISTNQTANLSGLPNYPFWNSTQTKFLVPVNGSSSINLDNYFADPDGDALTYLSTTPENFSINVLFSMLTAIPDFGFSGIRNATVYAFDANHSASQEISFWVFEMNATTNVSINATNTTIENSTLVQFDAEIGKPVKWMQLVDINDSEYNATNFTIRLPELAENITAETFIEGYALEISSSNISVELKEEELPVVDGEFGISANEKPKKFKEMKIKEKVADLKIEYFTPAPVASEKNISFGRKQVTVSAEMHYENILTYASLPFEAKPEKVKLYWIKNGTKVLFENITLIDSNNNSLIDFVQWTTPHLSNQTFELSIEILNVQSFPIVGGNWTVAFNTTGAANLSIRASNGTNWTNTNETGYDLQFLELKCGNTTLNYSWVNSSVFYENYSCEYTSYEISKVLTSGKHTIEFNFGDYIAYAKNLASANLSCIVRQSSCVGNEVPVIRMSNHSDAHAEQVNGTDYTYIVCCNDTDNRNTLTNSSGTVVANLSSSTDAHTEIPGTSDYSYPVYLGADPDNVTCSYDYVSGNCAENSTCLFTMSGTTDAHIADCTTDPYNLTVCCGFQINNRAPTMTSVVINSSLGTNKSNENIICWASSNDLDNDNVSYNGYWYKNGVQNISFNTYPSEYLDSLLVNVSTLSSSYILAGENWSCSVRANDGTENGSYMSSVNLTVIAANTAPNTTQVILNSTSGHNLTTDDLKCYANATDAQGDNVTFYYRWYNGSSLFSSGSLANKYENTLYLVSTLSSSNTQEGENWKCSILAGDGILNETSWNNATLTIVSSPIDWNRIYNLTNWIPNEADIGDYGMAVDFDSQRNVIVAGRSYISNTPAASGMFLIKYSSSGSVLWSINRTFDNDYYYDGAYGVAVGSQDSIIVAGEGAGSWFAKYNSSGSLIWEVNNTLASRWNDVALDPSGNIILGGLKGTPGVIAKFNSSGSLIWNRTLKAAIYGIDSDSSGNVYAVSRANATLYKYDSSGNYLWNLSADFDTSSNKYLNDVASDSSGNPVVLGTYWSSDFNKSLFVVRKYNSSGSSVWTTVFFNSSSEEYAYSNIDESSLDIDSNNNIAFTGSAYLNNTVWISQAGYFTAKLNPSGVVIWNATYIPLNPSSYPDYSYGVAINNYNEIAITGSSPDISFPGSLYPQGYVQGIATQTIKYTLDQNTAPYSTEQVLNVSGSGNLDCYHKAWDDEDENLTVYYYWTYISPANRDLPEPETLVSLGKKIIQKNNLNLISSLSAAGLNKGVEYRCYAKVMDDSEQETLWSVSNYTTGAAFCGDTLNSNTYNVLLQDVSTSGNCFTIGGHNITLDCMGHKITGPATTGYAVYAAALRNNLTLKNCFIQDFQYGVYTAFANSLFYNNTFNSTYQYSIFLDGDAYDNNNISKNTFMNVETASGGGIHIRAGDNDKIYYNNFSKNNGVDIRTSGTMYNTQIRHNIFNKNNLNYAVFNINAYGDTLHFVTLENNTITNVGTGANAWAYDLYYVQTPITFVGTNLVDGKNASEYFYYNKSNIVIENLHHNASEKVSSLGEFAAYQCNNITVRNSNLTNHVTRNVILYSVNNSNFSNNNMSRTVYTTYWLFECSNNNGPCHNLTIAYNNMASKYGVTLYLHKSTNARIRNNNMNSTSGYGIFYISQGRGYIIENNHVRGVTASVSSYAASIYGAASGDGNGIIRNNSFGGGMNGFVTSASALANLQNVSIYNNRFYRGYYYDMYVSSGNLLIYNNTFYNNAGAGTAAYFGGNAGTAAHLFANNTIKGTPYHFGTGVMVRTKNLRIYNNKVVNVTAFGFDFGGTANDGNYARNNVTLDNTVNGNPVYHYWKKTSCPDLSNKNINLTKVSTLGVALVDMPNNCVVDNSNFTSDKATSGQGISLINTSNVNITRNIFKKIFYPIGFVWLNELSENDYIAHNNFDDSYTGIYYYTIKYAKSHTIYNNTFIGSDYAGIYKYRYNDGINNKDNANISGNTFTSSASNDIYLSYTVNNTIKNNRFQNPVSYSLYLSSAANNTIKNNNFTNSPASASNYYIMVSNTDSKGNNITHNYLNGSGYGIYYSNAGANNKFAFNRIYNSGVTAVYTINAFKQNVYNNTFCYNKVPFSSNIPASYTMSTIGWHNNSFCIKNIYPTNGTTVNTATPLFSFNASNLMNRSTTNCSAVVNGTIMGSNASLAADGKIQKIQSSSLPSRGWYNLSFTCYDVFDDVAAANVILFNYPYAPVINSIVLNSTFGTNATDENLTVYANITDQDTPNPSNQTKWYKNSRIYPALPPGVDYTRMLLFLPFENYTSASDRLRDYSPLNNTVTNTGATWNATGDRNSYGSYDFASSYMDTEQINFNSRFTVMVWVNSDVANQGSFIRILETSYATHFYLGTTNAGNGYKWIVNSASFPYGTAEGGTITAGKWQLVAGTYNGSLGRLYVNGVNVANSTFTSPGIVTDNVVIGRYSAGLSNYWNGKMDSIMIFNYSLSSADILNIYNNRTSSTILADETEVGDVWKACITASDGTFSITNCSNNLTVLLGNEAPNTTRVFINSTSGLNLTTDSLKCYANATDVDGDNITFYYKWYNNSVLVPSLSGSVSNKLPSVINLVSTVGSGNTTKGQTWKCSIKANDGTVNETDWNNATITILNSAPTHASPILNATDNPLNKTTANLTVYAQSTADADSDNVRNIISWYKDNSAVMKLLLPFEGGSNSTYTKDYSDSSLTSRVIGADFVSYGHTGSAYKFDGSTDYIQFSDSLDMGLQDWTACAWINNTKDWAAIAWGPGIVGKSYYGGEAGRWSLFIYKNELGALIHGSSLVTIDDEGTVKLNDSKWHYVCAVFDRSQNMTTYVDGVKDASLSISSNVNYNMNGARNLTVGLYAEQPSKTGFFQGMIDEVNVYNITLSQEQIIALYHNRTDLIVSEQTEKGDIWKACITPNDGTEDGIEKCSNNLTIENTAPTTGTPILNATDNPLNSTSANLTVYAQSTADADSDSVKTIYNWYKDSVSLTLLNMPFEGGSNTTWTKDYSGYSNDGAVKGTGFWNSSGGYDSKGAYKFDGSGDYISVGDAGLNNQSGTISLWVKLPSYSNYPNIFSTNDLGSNDAIRMEVSTSFCGTNRVYMYDAGAGCSAFAAFSTNTWTMLTVAWSGSRMLGYTNGALSFNSSRTVGVTVNDLVFGRGFDANRYFTGTLDEVLVFNSTLSKEQVNALYLAGSQKIVSQETEKGDIWKACITPNDGATDGIEKCSNNLTIENTAPVVSAAISPASPNSSSDLNCTYTASDVDGDSLSASFNWFKNNVAQNINNQILAAGNTSVGELWNCSANVSDSEDWTLDVSDAVLIGDDLKPYFTNPSNTSSDFRFGSTFTANITINNYALDYYIFSTNASGSWSNTTIDIAGAQVNASRSATIAVGGGKRVCWYYWANDTAGNSNVSSTYCFTVQNTAPTQSTPFIGAHEPSGIFMDSGIAGYWAFENNAKDEKGKINGTVTEAVHTEEGRVGKAYDFDGTNDKIAFTPASTGHTPGFTVSAWIQANNPSSATRRGIAGVQSKWFFEMVSGGLHWYNYEFNSPKWISTSSVISDTGWHHAVVTFNGTKVVIYVDGLNKSSANEAGSVTPLATPFEIGDSPGVSRYWNGSLDEVIIWNRSLSASEVKALYNYTSGINNVKTTMGIGCSANATSDVDSDTTVNIFNWYKNNVSVELVNIPFEGGSNTTYTKDYSGFGNSVSASGSPVWNATGGHAGTGAYRLDGVNDLLTATNNKNIHTNATSFSVTYWFNSPLTSANQGHLQKGAGSFNNGGYGWEFRTQGTTLEFTIHNSSTGAPTRMTRAGLTANKWNFIAMTHNQTTGQTKLYVNGVVGNAVNYVGYYSDIYNLVIGKGTDGYFNGSIDNVILWNRTLSAEQVRMIYVNGTQNIVSQETLKGQQWHCSAVPNDGTADGTLKNSSYIYIENSFPEVSAAISPASPNSSSDLNCTYTASDVDGDSLSASFNWFKNNVAQNINNQILAAGNTSVGELWNCSANVSDSEDWTLDVSDAVLIGDDLKPYFTNPSNTSSDFRFGSTFTANITINNYALDYYIFSTNASGSWSNTTIDIAGAQVNASRSATIAVGGGKRVCWYYWANDTAGNSNVSSTYCFTVQNSAPSHSTPFIGAHEPSTPYMDSYMMGYWPFENNAKDEKGKNNGTLSGGPLHTSDGRIGKAYYFDNVDDYMRMTSSSTSMHTSQAVTMAGWIKFGTLGADWDYVGGKDASYMLAVNSGRYLQPHINVASSWRFCSGAATQLQAGRWYFLAVTYSSTDKTIRGYLDGNLECSNNLTSLGLGTYNISSSGNDFYISTYQTSARTNASIDEVMVWSRQLSASEMKSLYNYTSGRNNVKTTMDIGCSSNLTADSDGNSVKQIFSWYRNNAPIAQLNMPFEGGSNTTWTKDYSGNARHGTVSQAVYLPSGGYDGKGAYNFSGSSQYIASGTIPAMYNYTVTFWAKWNDYGTSNVQFITAAANEQLEIHTGGGSGTNGLRFIPRGGIYLDVANAIPDSNYHHYAMVYKTNNEVIAYRDGVKIGNKTHTTSTASTANVLNLGRRATNNYFFKGRIDEVNVFNRSLSADQVKMIYRNASQNIVDTETKKGETWKCSATPNDGSADGTSKNSTFITILNSLPSQSKPFIGAHEPVGIYKDSSLVGFWPFENTAKDALGKLNGTVVGAEQVEKGRSGKAYEFQYGKTEYIYKNSAGIDLGYNFAISAWVNRYSYTGDEGWIKFNTAWNSGSNAMPHIRFTSGGFMFRYDYWTGGGTGFTPASLTNNAWHHYVVTFNSTHACGYYDGALVSCGAQTGRVNTSTSNLYLGVGYLNRVLNGSLDEVAVWNRSLSAAEVKSLYNYTSGRNNVKTTMALGCSANATSDYDSDSTSNIYTWYKSSAPFASVYLPFEGGSTSSYTKDYSGNSKTITVTGSPTWSSTAGYKGTGAYALNGVTGQFSVPNVNFINGTEKWSIMLWAYPKKYALSQTGLFTKSNGWTNPWMVQGRDACSSSSNCQLKVNYMCNGCFITTTSLVIDKWQHIAITFDGHHLLRVYFDGKEDASSPFNVSAQGVLGNTVNLAFATGGAYYTDRFNGSIDDAMIFNSELSPEQIYYIYTNGTQNIADAETSKGETWKCSITPNDLSADGASSNSSLITILNSAPFATLNYPANGATGIELSPRLNVTVTDYDNDEINATFINASSGAVISTDSEKLSGEYATSIWSGLSEVSTYFWKVNATDGYDTSTSSTWNFTTDSCNCTSCATCNAILNDTKCDIARLVNNITGIGSGTSCIMFNLTSKTFDCTGHTITSAAGGSNKAVTIDDVSYSTVKNCTFVGFGYGIYANSSTNLDISDVSVLSGGNGIYESQFCQDSVFDSITITNMSSTGFRIAGRGTNASNAVISEVLGYSLQLASESNGSVLTNVSVYNATTNLYIQPALSSSSTFINFEVGYNSTTGKVSWPTATPTYAILNTTNLILNPDFVSMNSSDLNTSAFNLAANISLSPGDCTNVGYFYKSGFPTTLLEILNGTRFYPAQKDCTAGQTEFSADSYWSGYAYGHIPQNVTLYRPSNGNTSAFFRNMNFTWNNSWIANSHALKYNILVDDQSNFGSPLINISNIAEGTSLTSYITPVELDLSNPYFWKVRAYDSQTMVYGEYSLPWNFSIQSVKAITVLNGFIDFGEMALHEANSTEDNNPMPFLIENSGNIPVNLTINASALFTTESHPSDYYRFKIGVNESNSFNQTASNMTWVQMPSAAGSPSVRQLNYYSYYLNSTCEIDLNITVPPHETPGAKTSSVLVQS